MENKPLWLRDGENLTRLLGLLAVTWCVTFWFAGLAQGQTYQWTDEEGRVHFSDSPPIGQSKDLEEVDIQVNQLKYDPLVHERRKNQKKFLNTIVEEKKTKQKIALQKKNNAAKEKRRCDQLRAQYQRYKYAGAVYRRDKENPSERVFFNDAERAAYLEGIQKKISKSCQR